MPDSYFFLLWTVGWLLSSTATSWRSGHKALLERYPPVDEPVEESFNFAGGSIGGVNFKSALHVGIGTRGLHLAPNVPFRSPFFRGIPCIPWSELRCIHPQEDRDRFPVSTFEVPALDLRFKLRGQPGRAIERRLGSVPLGRS
ncbi:MAG: hypothetical protein ACXU86_07985 [Archangium sp.]